MKVFLNLVKRLDKGGRGIVYLPRRSTAAGVINTIATGNLPVINIPFQLHRRQERISRGIVNGYQQSVKNFFNNDSRLSRAADTSDELGKLQYLLCGSSISNRAACRISRKKLYRTFKGQDGKMVLHLFRPGNRRCALRGQRLRTALPSGGVCNL